MGGDLKEIGRQLRGLPTSYEHCRDVFDTYCADLTRANLDRVREANGLLIIGMIGTLPYQRKSCTPISQIARLVICRSDEKTGWP